MLTHRPRLSGVATGLAVTVVCSLYFFVFQPEGAPELFSFDLRASRCGPLSASAPIVHVDIDDNALLRVGRWPWRRDELADFLRALHELGPEVIAVDILLSEPEPPRLDDPRYSRDADVEGAVETLGALSARNVIFGDLELADAVRTAGNVYLPFQLEVRLPGEPPSFLDRLRAAWRENPAINAAQAVAVLGLENTAENRQTFHREFLRLRIADLLRKDFTLSETRLAAALDVPAPDIYAVLAGIKSEVAEELVAEQFAAGPVPTFDAVLEAILGVEKDRTTADRADVLAAYREQLGLRAALAAARPLSADLERRTAVVTRATAPHFLLGEAARQVGAVTFRPDADGATRRVPLLVDFRGRALKQLGFAVACDVLGLDVEHATLEADDMLMLPRRDGSAPMAVPLDGNGNLIINWTRTAKDWRAFKDFPHISAAKVWALADARRQIQRNTVAIAYAYADVVRAAKGDIQVAAAEGAPPTTMPGDYPYRVKVNEYIELEQRVHLARLRGASSPEEQEQARVELATRRAALASEQRTAAAFIRRSAKDLEEIPAEEFMQDAGLRAVAERIRGAVRLLDGEIAANQAANERIEQTRQLLVRELAPEIQGKYVFLGYAATAEGDIVKTPVDPETIGVMCHAQVLNSFLQERFIHRAGRGLEIALCLLLGAGVAVLTALRGPRLALSMTIALILAYALFNAYVVFLRFDTWLALAGALVTMAAVWAFVTLFRQLTAERERRIFAGQLSQYTSPALAARLAEDPEAAQAFKTVQTREMTLFFSDLAGFTTITEQENAEVVQHVLNNYLERMAQTIWSHQGLVSKFMGDGIMALFNSSVSPLPDHAIMACETALLTLEELEKLKVERQGDPAAPIFERLSKRIGLATGPCKNGDLGSALKADYTAIGDVVNLAARLEPANKVFGTRIMVAGPTRAAAGDRFEFRYLAELQVKGKAQTVPVYELICRRGELADEQRQYVERFEAGVELYKQRKWDECIVHYTRLLARRFDDLGASRYIDACQEMKAFPPDDAWAGALALKEK